MFPHLNNKKVILTYKDNVKLTAVELQHKLLFCVGLLLALIRDELLWVTDSQSTPRPADLFGVGLCPLLVYNELTVIGKLSFPLQWDTKLLSTLLHALLHHSHTKLLVSERETKAVWTLMRKLHKNWSDERINADPYCGYTRIVGYY